MYVLIASTLRVIWLTSQPKFNHIADPMALCYKTIDYCRNCIDWVVSGPRTASKVRPRRTRCTAFFQEGREGLGCILIYSYRFDWKYPLKQQDPLNTSLTVTTPNYFQTHTKYSFLFYITTERSATQLTKYTSEWLGYNK